MKIAVCGGGTGGHYYPALAFIKGLAENRNVEVLYFTIKGKIDDKKIKKDFPEVEKYPLEIQGLYRPLYNLKNIEVILNHRKNIRIVKNKLMEFSPDFIFSTGGYVSYPVIKAAHLLNKKIYIHSQNAKPGLSNQKLSKFADKIFISFDESKEYFSVPKEKIVFSGIPIRKCKPDKIGILNNLKIPSDTPVILIVGGSFGSPIINETMMKIYQRGFQGIFYIHVTGKEETTEKFNHFDFVKAFNYIDNLHEYIGVVNGVISSGGASSIAELKYYNTPGVIVPKKYAAENHQYYNGKSLEKYGLGYVILENRLDDEILSLKIKEILSLKKPQKKDYEDPVSLMIEVIEQGVEF